MRSLSGLVLSMLLLASGCERRNQLYCDDQEVFCGRGQRCDTSLHRCVDEPDLRPQAQPCAEASSCTAEAPICDPQELICRACLPGEDRRCQERDEATPRCLSPRCVQCIPPGGTESLQATECTRRSAVQPVCDQASNTCRKCRLHRECASGVCAKDALSDAAHGVPEGSCVSPEMVVAVDASACSPTGPVYCNPRQAVARLNSTRRYLLIRRAGARDVFSNIEISDAATQGVEIYVIGPMADEVPTRADLWPRSRIGADRGFVVGRNMRVTIEGFVITGNQVAVECVGVAGGMTRARVLRSLVADSPVGILARDECVLHVEESWLGASPRPEVEGPERFLGNVLALQVERADFSLVNSVLTENGVRGGIFGGIRIRELSGGMAGRKVSTIVNSTFVSQEGQQMVGGQPYTNIVCEAPVGGRLLIANSLFFQSAGLAGARHVTPNCGDAFAHLGSDDTTLPGALNVVVPAAGKPGFRAPQDRDFHLLASDGTAWQEQIRKGGAASVMLAGSKVQAPEVDLDRAPRPLNAGRVAMGAYEPR